MCTILVVDDEKLVLTLLTRVLKETGYTVLTASSGEEALEILKTIDTVDVLLTDLKMPGMSGFQLASEALGLFPDLRVVYMTGYSDEAAGGSLPPGRHEVLLKPFNRNTLLARLMTVVPETQLPQSRLMPRVASF